LACTSTPYFSNTSFKFVRFNSYKGGEEMGMAEVLTIVFVLLKLTDIITWSWWLVLLPALLSFSLYVIIIVVKLIMVMVAVFAVKKRDVAR